MIVHGTDSVYVQGMNLFTNLFQSLPMAAIQDKVVMAFQVRSDVLVPQHFEYISCKAL